jgi:hypothetical protein
VFLSRGAANRLDLASGDSFSLVSGGFGVGIVETTAGRIHANENVEIEGALDHDGATIGFYGVAPVVRSASYAPTNVTTDRSYDADATTVDELADVLGTLIADLQLTGIIG